MKKLLFIILLLIITGCNNEEVKEKEVEKGITILECTQIDESGKGITIFTFEDGLVINLKTSIEFNKEVDAEAVCELYKSIALDDIKVVCDNKIVSMESSKVALEHEGKTRKELKKELEESGYTCK